MNSTQETGRDLQLRAQLYRWLSNCYVREVDQSTLSNYLGKEGEFFLNGLMETPSMKEGVEALQGALKKGVPPDDLVLQLASAYSFLFLGVGGRRTASLYESVYTSKNHCLYQEAHVQMKELLHRHELTAPEGFREPMDHIAVQLDLMAQLAQRAASLKLPKQREAFHHLVCEQKEFLEQHLLNWIPQFCGHCVEYDLSGFYKGAALILKALLEEDRLYLEDLTEAYA